MNIKLYYDRTLKKELNSSLLEELVGHDLIVPDDKFTISFVGTIIYDDCINIFLPRSSTKIYDDDSYKYAALTMSAVEKFSRSSKTKLNSKDKGGSIIGQLNLTLIKSILDDFQQNGLYTRRYKETHINSGKPNWKKTVSRFLPLISKNGPPVYLDYFSTKNKQNSNNPISQIHADIVAYLDVNFSWWITGNGKSSIAPELILPKNIHDKTQVKLSILQHELFNIYSERDIRLINNLIEFIKQLEGMKNSPIICGLKDFHNAWEARLRSVSSGVVNLNSHLPKPTYVDINGKIDTTQGMLTDIIIENVHGTELVILDAKYYSATNVRNSPHLNDIVKQFYYQKAVNIIKPKHIISNYFIFPGDSGHFTYINMQINKVSYDEVFGPINCLYICPLKVMENYINGSKVIFYETFKNR